MTGQDEKIRNVQNWHPKMKRPNEKTLFLKKLRIVTSRTKGNMTGETTVKGKYMKTLVHVKSKQGCKRI